MLERNPFETLDQTGVGRLIEIGVGARPRREARTQARHLRRARRRPGLGRVLPPRRPGLRVVLAVPRADRPACRRAGGAGSGRLAGDERRRRRIHARRPGRLPVAVVIDVLRATTTITRRWTAATARCWPAATSTRRASWPARWPAARCWPASGSASSRRASTSATRRSEFEGEPRAETIVLTTTNGTRAIVTAAGHAEAVVIGSLLNLLACASKVARTARSGAATC